MGGQERESRRAHGATTGKRAPGKEDPVAYAASDVPEAREHRAQAMQTRVGVARYSLDLAAGLPEEARYDRIEVTDAGGRPLVCLRPESAIRQKLRYRLVAIGLRRREQKLVLVRRSDPRLGDPGRWDLLTGFTGIGEAAEDTAFRLLWGAGLHGCTLKQLGCVFADAEQRVRIHLYESELSPGLYPGASWLHAGDHVQDQPGAMRPGLAEVLEADADELYGITARSPELFTAELLRGIASGLLFDR